MTSINNITNNPVNLQSLTGQMPVKSGDGDGDHGIEPSSAQSQTTSFTQSLQQTLSQLNGGSSIVTSNSAQTAIQTFMQQLLAALHQAGAGNTQNASQQSDGDGDVGTGPPTAAHARHHGGHHHAASNYSGTLQADLQSLIQQASASSSSNPALQQSFQNMLGAMGATDGTNTLNGFLQSLAANMQGSSLISTTA